MNLEEYKIKADEGSAKAQCTLGIFYYKGEQGAEKDYEKAFYWLKKAADQDYAYAIYRLGICYLEGKGVDADQQKAMQYISAAAEKGDEDARYYIQSIKKDNNTIVNTKEDPYRDAYKAQHKNKYKQTTKKAGFWFREVKINAMLTLIAIVMAIAATIIFIVVFGDRWDPNVMDRRVKYMAVGSLFFSFVVLVLGRYSTKLIHKIYKRLRH